MVDVISVNQIQQGIVNTAPAGSYANASTQNISVGRSGEAYSADLHGKWYTAALAGRVFTVATAAAGTTITAQATNIAAKFVLLNPITSSVNVELIRYTTGLLVAANQVVSDVSLYWQPGIGSSAAALASTTALTIKSSLLGGSATAQSLGYSAATFTNTIGTDSFRGPTLYSTTGTTALQIRPIVYDFDGSFILAPGTAVFVAATTVQTNATTSQLTFAEWPI